MKTLNGSAQRRQPLAAPGLQCCPFKHIKTAYLLPNQLFYL